MKKIKKKAVAWVLVFSLTAGSTSFASAAEKPANEKTMLWSSSFEESTRFQDSTLDENRGTSGINPDLSGALQGDITYKVDLASVTGSANYNSTETKVNIFDSNSGTKFLANVGVPVTVQWSLKNGEKKQITTYQLVAANDAQERDPKSWTLYGRNGEGEWAALDTQTNITFTARYQTKQFSIAEAKQGEYSSYKLEITAKYGSGNMVQFADIVLATGNPMDNQYQINGMSVKIAKGPAAAWNQKSSAGWTGSKSLEARGSVAGDKAYSYDVIYKDLNTPVTADTYLDYVIFPSMSNGDVYDYKFTQMYFSVDLKFSDGTYLSELAAIDQNENRLDPLSQGKSRTLTTNQWNHIYSKIGAVAAGKTVSEILIVYKNDRAYNAKDLNNFITYFDDISIYNQGKQVVNHLSDYTNILRGTNDTPTFSRGLTAPAVTMPHGFNFWAPATNSGDNKIYDYQDTQMRFITVSHEPSYWVGDRGTWQFMVNTSYNAATQSPGISNAYADFSHDKEVAHAHYYSVEFDKANGSAKGAKLELTPTEHAAVVRFTYDADVTNRNVIFDCVRAGGGITFDNSGTNTTFTGYSDHMSNGSKRMYVYGSFNAKAVNVNTSGKTGIASFSKDVVEMKIATSYISYEQAKKNLELEIAQSEGFDDIYQKAQKTWDDKLGIISDVKGATYEELVTLYSCMYRLLAYPNTMSENTGTNEAQVWKYKSPYRGSDAESVEGKIYINNGFWDTYRTAWAAYGLLTPADETEMLNGLVQHYKDQGWVPRWIAPGGTNSMVGTSSDVIFADAMVKGIKFDYENAYLSAIRNAASVSTNLTNGGRNGLDTGIFLGYTPGSGEDFSWSIEGYINDFGISQMAKILAEKETDPLKKTEYESEYQYYVNRAKNYVKLFNDSGETELEDWLRGKTASGEWTTANNTNNVFDPLFWGNDYTETNAYNMAVSVPQDGRGLANLYGGNEQLANKLDSIFETENIYNGYGATNSVGGIHEQKEAREVKLGQYGHSNQPSHHIIYMYNYAAEPWMTQSYVRDVLDRCYTGGTFGQGYIGDEDNGEMSAWYILSALGFYPVSMGSDEYAIGSPLFDEVTLNLESGRKLVIRANNNSKDNVYVQSMKVNGENYTKSYIKHEDLIHAGVIEFTMGAVPNKNWGSGDSDLPTSLTIKGEMPQAYDDIMSKSAKVVNTATSEAIKVYFDEIASETANVSNLIDNTSSTSAILAEGAKVTYHVDKAKRAQVFTLTSSSDPAAAPSGVKLYGAKDGEAWTLLASYDNISFRWAKYTRPFLIPQDKQGEYEHYQFEFSGGTLAETELLGYSNELRDRDSLGNLIRAAKAMDTTDLSSTLVMVLRNAVASAEAIYVQPDLDIQAYTDAYNTLKNAIAVVSGGYRTAVDTIQAESFDSGNVLVDKVNGVPNNIGGVQKNYWACYKNVLFQGNIDFMSMYYSAQGSDGGGYTEIYVDSISPENLVGSVQNPVTAASGWATYTTASATLDRTVNGLHDVYLVFRNDGTHAYVANVDWFVFSGSCSISLQISGQGQARISEPVVSFGGESQITLEPEDGYKVAELVINGKAVNYDGSGTYTLSNIRDNIEVNVRFVSIADPEPTSTPEPSDDPGDGGPMNPIPTQTPPDSDSDKETQLPETDAFIYQGDNFYKVIKAAKTGGTVSYQGTLNLTAEIARIPASITINGVSFKVTKVGASAFKNNKVVKKVVIGKNVTSFGAKAFAGAEKLKVIYVRTDQLTSFGGGVFENIPKTVVIKVPKAKYKDYVKMFRENGLDKKIKIMKE